MAKLNIPSRYRAGVSQIRKLDQKTVQEIRNLLDRVFANRNLDDVAVAGTDEIATTALAAFPSESVDFKELATALTALYSVKSRKEDLPIEEFVEDVCDSMEALDSAELKLPHADRDRFRENLTTLLKADIFAVVAKANDLKTDDERTFCHARILTDLRPVFGQQVADGPQAMVVVHLLKLGYHQGSDKHQQFYVSLDSDDLEELRKHIDRAEAKAKSLRSVVKNDIRVFGIAKE